MGVSFLIGAGVAAVSSYLFSHKALLDISVGSHTDSLTIKTLQDHEKRVTLNNRSIEILESNVKYLLESEHMFKQYFHTLHLVDRVEHSVDQVMSQSDSIIEGMYNLHNHRLSPKLVEVQQLVPLMAELKQRVETIGRKLISTEVEDVFRFDTSHLVLTMVQLGS